GVSFSLESRPERQSCGPMARPLLVRRAATPPAPEEGLHDPVYRSKPFSRTQDTATGANVAAAPIDHLLTNPLRRTTGGSDRLIETDPVLSMDPIRLLDLRFREAGRAAKSGSQKVPARSRNRVGGQKLPHASQFAASILSNSLLAMLLQACSGRYWRLRSES